MSNTAPDIKVDIVLAPSMKDMTVSQVGQNMFSINMNIVAVVRFANGEMASSDTLLILNNTPNVQPTYSNGTSPQPGGETAAFNDFARQHGYTPQSREILAEWVKLQQGGA